MASCTEVPSFRSLLLKHGYALLFGNVLLVQAGAPVPADPLLLLMGALTRDGDYRFLFAMLLGITAALIGDLMWYEIGRWKGRSVLALLCRMSIEPDTCVRNTEAGFAKRGAWTLLFAKFVPGVSLISMPLAGAIRMARWRFFLADAAGSAIWVSAYMLAGFLLHRQVEKVIQLLGLFGSRAGLMVVLLLALYLGWKFFQRWRFRRELRINRVTPEEAFDLMQSGRPITMVDLRHPGDIENTGFKIMGAMVIDSETLRSRSHEIPAGNDVILYCT